jgi:hypothetical protein
MRLVKFYLLLLFPLALSAQESANQHPEYAYVSLLYGGKNYTENFYNQFNTLQHTTLFNPVQVIGIGVCTPPDHFKTKKGKLARYVQHLSYSQVIPQEIRALDTVSARLTGFVFSASIGLDLLGNSKHFNLMVSGGFNTGRLRMYQNELLRQKNPFFSPKISVEPGVRFGKVILSLKVEYEYDISSGNWRRTFFANKDKANLNSFQQSGLTTLISVGYVIIREGDKKFE